MQPGNNWKARLGGILILTCGWVLAGGCTPPGPRALLEGEKLIKAGRFPEAIEKLKHATAVIGQNAQTWNHLGLAYHYGGQPREAVRAYQEALSKNPNLAAARFNLGCLRLEAGDLRAAEDDFFTYTNLKPGDSEGWLKLGTAQLRSRDYGAAERSFQNALKLNPRLPEAWNGLGVACVRRGDPKVGWKHFRSALEQEERYAPALLNLAITTHNDLQNPRLALPWYQQYLAHRSNVPEAPAVRRVIDRLEYQLNPPPPTNQIAAVPRRIVPSRSPIQPAPAPPRPAPEEPPGDTTNPASNPPSLAGQTETAIPPEAAVTPANQPEPDLDPTSAPASASSGVTQTNALDHVVTPAHVEVVELAEQFRPQPARDVEFEVEPSPSPPSEATAAMRNGDRVTSPDTARIRTLPPPRAFSPSETPPAGVLTGPDAGRASEDETSPGFLSRINPINLFRGRDEDSGSSGVESRAERPRAGASDPAARTTPSVPAPVPPAFPRYAYQVRQKPQAGDPSKAAEFVREGVTAHRQQRLGVAVEAYLKATDADPAYFEAQYNLGLAAYQIREWPLSLSAYEQALAIKPTSVDTRYNFALALRDAGYPVDAANELERLLLIDPNEVRSHFTLANLYSEQLLEPELARRHYRKVLDLNPRHPQAVAIRYWVNANP